VLLDFEVEDVDVVLEALLVVDDVVDVDDGRVDDFIDVIMEENGMELIMCLDGLIDGIMVGMLDAIDTKENPEATDTVGAPVGVTKLKPDGTKFGSKVLVYVKTVGTAMPVGAAVGTSGNSTDVKTFGASEATPGVDCCGEASFGTRRAIVCVAEGSKSRTSDAKGAFKSEGSPLTTTGGNPDCEGPFSIWRAFNWSIWAGHGTEKQFSPRRSTIAALCARQRLTKNERKAAFSHIA
jgi:hypothetical protein